MSAWLEAKAVIGIVSEIINCIQSHGWCGILLKISIKKMSFLL
jgi:hypothetical protein